MDLKASACSLIRRLNKQVRLSPQKALEGGRYIRTGREHVVTYNAFFPSRDPLPMQFAGPTG